MLGRGLGARAVGQSPPSGHSPGHIASLSRVEEGLGAKVQGSLVLTAGGVASAGQRASPCPKD